jgi:hypothetical protein
VERLVLKNTSATRTVVKLLAKGAFIRTVSDTRLPQSVR